MIEIRDRLRPFSHQPGVCCLIPTTDHCIRVFPTRLFLQDQEIEICKLGPITNFTVVQDLERCCVTVFCHQYCYHVLPSLEISWTKHPSTSSFEGARYHFGIHKKQEWQLIAKRCDIREFFPLWLRLGSLLKLPLIKHDNKGMFQLFHACEQAILAHQPHLLATAFTNLFKAGFEGMMVPRAIDTDFQGFLPNPTTLSSISALHLLPLGAELIRSLFIQEKEKILTLLPNLPPELFAGRITGESTFWGALSLRWQQKRLREVELVALNSGDLILQALPDIKRFRVRKNKEKNGRWVVIGTELAIEASNRYLFDRFER